MKAILIPIQSMYLIHGFDQVSSMAERGKMIQEHFDELTLELLMK
jgi:hypothetical protein